MNALDCKTRFTCRTYWPIAWLHPCISDPSTEANQLKLPPGRSILSSLFHCHIKSQLYGSEIFKTAGMISASHAWFGCDSRSACQMASNGGWQVFRPTAHMPCIRQVFTPHPQSADAECESPDSAAYDKTRGRRRGYGTGAGMVLWATRPIPGRAI